MNYLQVKQCKNGLNKVTVNLEQSFYFYLEFVKLYNTDKYNEIA